MATKIKNSEFPANLIKAAKANLPGFKVGQPFMTERTATTPVGEVTVYRLWYTAADLSATGAYGPYERTMVATADGTLYRRCDTCTDNLGRDGEDPCMTCKGHGYKGRAHTNGIGGYTETFRVYVREDICEQRRQDVIDAARRQVAAEFLNDEPDFADALSTFRAWSGDSDTDAYRAALDSLTGFYRVGYLAGPAINIAITAMDAVTGRDTTPATHAVSIGHLGEVDAKATIDATVTHTVHGRNARRQNIAVITATTTSGYTVEFTSRAAWALALTEGETITATAKVAEHRADGTTALTNVRLTK